MEKTLKLKTVLTIAISGIIGAALGSYLSWMGAAKEHKQIMRLEMNKDYIDSLDGISTGVNIIFSMHDFQDSIAKCLENSKHIASINSLTTDSFSIYGWKEYLAQGVIVYTTVNSLGQNSPVYACILESDGNLYQTRQVLPHTSLNDNWVMAISSPALIQADF